MTKNYDYIIAGGGCAGLSLAYKMAKNAWFDDKQILVIEKDQKNKNDRTWCHWSNQKEIFDHLNFKTWDQIIVAGNGSLIERKINPYHYKMIRGLDFYKYVIPSIKAKSNIDYQIDEILEINESDNCVKLKGRLQEYSGKFLFDSFSKVENNHKDHFVLQHFRGWFVKSKDPYFDPNKIHFMDFRTPQNNETRFFYVLPSSPHEALIELAIFSNDVLTVEEYDDLIKNYIHENHPNLQIEIVEEEIGIIPMTTQRMGSMHEGNQLKIGTVAGNVKPSSGFAFKRIQDFTDAIVKSITEGKHPVKAFDIFKNRHLFFDKIFLNVLLTHKASGEKVFLEMFKKLSPQKIFKFLDEESSVLEELSIFTGPPTLPFVRALIDEIIPSSKA